MVTNHLVNINQRPHRKNKSEIAALKLNNTTNSLFFFKKYKINQQLTFIVLDPWPIVKSGFLWIIHTVAEAIEVLPNTTCEIFRQIYSKGIDR